MNEPTIDELIASFSVTDAGKSVVGKAILASLEKLAALEKIDQQANENKLENIKDNPQSWIAWKREATRLWYFIRNASIIEIACENPSVKDYMEHWEDRALKAEKKLAALEKPVPVEPLSGGSMKADELFNKYCHFDGVVPIVDKSDFMAALKEYGEHVKAEAVKVCEGKKAAEVMSKHVNTASCMAARTAMDKCAAAIEKMPLP